MCQLLVAGCFGATPPENVYFYSAVVTAHLELIVNAVMMLGLGGLVPHLNLSDTSLGWWRIMITLATWFNGISSYVPAVTGVGAALFTPRQAANPPPFGFKGPIAVAQAAVNLTVAALYIPVFIMAIVGLWRPDPEEQEEERAKSS